MLPGVADGSFGVEVAKLACLPSAIIGRAEEILHALAKNEHREASIPENDTIKIMPAMDDNAVRKLREHIYALEKELENCRLRLGALDEIDLDELSPKKAFDIIWALKGR